MPSGFESYLIIHSESPQVAAKLLEIFKPSKEGEDPDTLDIINNIQGTTYTYPADGVDPDEHTNFPPDELWEELTGRCSVSVAYTHSENPRECDISIESYSEPPWNFFITLRRLLQEIDSSCYIRGSYECMEYPEECGSFLYGLYGFDKVEELDKEYDWDKSIEDSTYGEEWDDYRISLEDKLHEEYLKYAEAEEKRSGRV